MLDFFIVNVALPSMQHDLHASAGAIEWIVAGYALSTAVFLIAAARFGHQIGRRRVFCAGLGLFTLSSRWCRPISRVSAGAAAFSSTFRWKRWRCCSRRDWFPSRAPSGEAGSTSAGRRCSPPA